MDDLQLGWQHKQAGRIVEAEACYRRALGGDPQNAQGWAMLGTLCFQQQRIDEAVEHFQKSLELRPGVAEVLANLGVACALKKDYAGAVERLREAVTIQPNFFEAYRNLGHVLGDCGKHSEAVKAYQQAIKLRPGDVDLLMNLGYALHKIRRETEAIEPLSEAVRLNPSVPVLQLLGASLAKAKRLDEAEACYLRALKMDPNDHHTHNGLGIILWELKKYDESEATLRRAIELDPKRGEPFMNLGNNLRDLDQYEEALKMYAKSLEICPEISEIHNNIGVLMGRIGKPREAIDAFTKGVELDPENVEAVQNRAILKLMMGEYGQTFVDYEARWQTKEYRKIETNKPKWKGEPLNGKRILILGEQGLGDIIQCIRYAPRIKERGGHVIFNCPKPLMKILAGLKDVDQFVPFRDPWPEFDFYAPVVSLPAIFETSLEDVPGIQDVPYVHADPELVEAWRNRLGPRDPGELRVGISWQGSLDYPSDRYRSVPLKAFLPLANVPGLKLYSFQKNDGVEQVAPMAEMLPIVEFGEELDGANGAFMDTAAIMRNMDLVITINSSLVHLAGALGVPTWLALSIDADWRWLWDREDSPWYPTLRVFRQAKLFEWNDVFERMANELIKRQEGVPKVKKPVKTIKVDVAPGELIDKITILEIKSEKITDPDKLANVRHELEILRAAQAEEIANSAELSAIIDDLKRVNLALWDVEDEIRICEREGCFDEKFIKLARSVYHQNDQRAALKRRINELLGSSILEEKSYTAG